MEWTLPCAGLLWDFARVIDEGGSRSQGDQRAQFALSYTF